MSCDVHGINRCTICIPGPPCPLCGSPQHPIEVRNSLSRYVDRYICSPCGMVEALRLHRLNDNPNARTCLYVDDLMGVALVNETEPGYVPIWDPRPEAEQFERAWVREYVEAVNARHGVTPADQMLIVSHSMHLAGF